MIPGKLLHRVACRICSHKSVARVVEPAIADFQNEYSKELRLRKPWRVRRVLAFGYICTATVVMLCVVEDVMSAFVPDGERRIILRSAGLLALTIAAATAAMVMAVAAFPIHFDWSVYRSHTGYLIARSAPLAIAIAVPFACATLCRTHAPSRAAIADMVGIVLALSAISFATSQWIVPRMTATANPDAATSARIYGVFTGLGTERFLALSREERRRMMLASTYPNHSITTSSRFISYSSGSIAAAPLVLAVFVFAACRQRRFTRFAAVLVPTAAVGLYLITMAFSDNRNLYPVSWWIIGADGRYFDAFPYLVWIPNVTLLALAIGFAVVSSRSSSLRGSVGPVSRSA